MCWQVLTHLASGSSEDEVLIDNNSNNHQVSRVQSSCLLEYKKTCMMALQFSESSLLR